MNKYWQNSDMDTLLNEVPVKVTQEEYDGNDCIKFEMQSGKEFMLAHRQDCCESVSIESIDGDIQRLLNLPILTSYESHQGGNEQRSSTWSFYTIGNALDSVTIRFYGESNGYYSEEASLLELK